MSMLLAQILTPQGVKFDDVADEVVLATPDGQLAILPHHEPLCAVVLPGRVKITVGQYQTVFQTNGGMLEVTLARARLLLGEAHLAP